ncbi:glycosyltransferase family 4 protein [Pseudomonas sp. NFX71]|uniref:glycosyltransferase family 4 protein n=1 Tax=Pseudomonas sp. NFX71 TaxID=3399121 RepID=UPI003A89EC86
MKLLVNASNLHFGGGVQVAASFIDELSRMESRAGDFSVMVSTEVNSNLMRIGCQTSGFARYEVFDNYGLSSVWASLLGKFKEYDLVFTVFGPAYFFTQRFLSVVGFAQAWIIYPDSNAAVEFSKFSRYKARFKYWLQSLFFRRADRLIVEADHVKVALVSNNIAGKEKVDVVPNCISSLYSEPGKWAPLVVDPVPSGILKVGYVGRDYVHKNLSVLPDVRRKLRESYQLDVEFYVTFSDDEWQERSAVFRREVKNVGVLAISQCPSFYQQMDAVIFPSLLECFSATPLEAMVMGKPLFASDRSFVRDVCKGWADYFEPLNTDDIARVMATYFSGEESVRKERLLAAQQHAMNYSSAQGRALRYLEIIEDVLNGR